MDVPNQLGDHNWWYSNSSNVTTYFGLLVSVAGLVISIWTLITAKSAKLAATEARDAANIRLLVDEIRRGESLSRELANHLRASRFAEALVRAQDLADLLLSIVEFWSSRMEEKPRAVAFDAKNDADQVLILIRKVLESQNAGPSRDLSRATSRNENVYQAFVKVRASLELERKS